MAVDIEKGTLSLNQVIANKIENFEIESDCIVPDVKPDILEIISTSGIINIYKKELQDGKIKIEGKILTYILYGGNSQNGKETRSIEHDIDFTQIIIAKNITSEMIEDGKITLNNIQCKIINERKVNIQASLKYDTKIYSVSNAEYISGVKVDDLQKLERKLNINPILGYGNTKASINENVTIEETDNVAEILKSSVEVANKEIKISYNKILAKADVKIKIMYLTEDNRICVKNATYPVVGFVEMNGIDDSSYCETNFEISNVLIKQNTSSDHSILVNIEFAIGCIAYKSKELDIITDMYSPKYNLEFTQKNIYLMQKPKVYNGQFIISQKSQTDIEGMVLKDVDLSFINMNVSTENSNVNIAGNVVATIFYYSGTSLELCSKKIIYPVEYSCPCSGLEDDKVNVSYLIYKNKYDVLPTGEIDANIDVNFIISTSGVLETKIIDSVVEGENKENQTNVVIYYVKDNEKIWDIAKKFRSTEEKIMSCNDLKSRDLTSGMQLFIPCC